MNESRVEDTGLLAANIKTVIGGIIGGILDCDIACCPYCLYGWLG